MNTHTNRHTYMQQNRIPLAGEGSKLAVFLVAGGLSEEAGAEGALLGATFHIEFPISPLRGECGRNAAACAG